MRARSTLTLLTLLTLTGLGPFAVGCVASGPDDDWTLCSRDPGWSGLDVWEGAIEDYEAADTLSPPTPGAVVFVGSSSIRFWDTLLTDMAPIPALNRGFGGSVILEVTSYADRIVLPYQPSAIVLYAGENDIAFGSSAACVLIDFQGFVDEVRAVFPSVPLYLVSLKPSPARQELWTEFQLANELLEVHTASDDTLHFIDVSQAMLDPQGDPDSALFGGDGLHMNAAGYDLWTSIIRPRLAADLGN